LSHLKRVDPESTEGEGTLCCVVVATSAGVDRSNFLDIDVGKTLHSASRSIVCDIVVLLCRCCLFTHVPRVRRAVKIVDGWETGQGYTTLEPGSEM
jgi:hypothetical protein